MKNHSAKAQNLSLKKKIAKIKLVLTDSDGVLTDTSVYYSEQGEIMKKFSIRDGMGVERLRNLLKIETGIITGELSPSVKKRAEKLNITELHLGIRDKVLVLKKILKKRKIKFENVAYIGDDVNDLEIMKLAGVSACPGDALKEVKLISDYTCENKGGYGAFREFTELIIESKTEREKV